MSNNKSLLAVRGMNDILPPDSSQWITIEAHARKHFEQYGYNEVRLPILESTNLFERGIGEDTDIVEKEMYTFLDKKERSLTLRPEMTASCVRAYIQHHVYKREATSRWYYMGPMFRYERMQSGRYRQFHQIGVEAFGITSPSLDAEMIEMLYRFYVNLGISNLTMSINSVGSDKDRNVYRTVIVERLEPYKEDLCANCQRRLTTNTLRILDCKIKQCIEIVTHLPPLSQYLSTESKAYFDSVQESLSLMSTPYALNPSLVRGLDYYTSIVFECAVTQEKTSVLAGGGRYDNFVEQLGGVSTSAVGFAMGTERTLMAMPSHKNNASLDVFIVHYGDHAKTQAIQIAQTLRNTNLCVGVEHRSTSLKSQLKQANKLNAIYVIIIGDDELQNNSVTLKNMETGTEHSVPQSELKNKLKELLA